MKGRGLVPLIQGSPTSGSQTGTSCQISSGIRLEIKCIINIMYLNHGFPGDSDGKVSACNVEDLGWKSLNNNCLWRKGNPPIPVGGNANWYSHYGEQDGGS